MKTRRVGPLEEFKDKWALEIGRFVLAFGSIEQVTHQALDHFPQDPIGEATRTMLLKPRLELLLTMLGGRSDKDWKDFAELLERAKKLSNDRNVIAHNPLGMDIYESLDGGDLMTRESIRSMRNREKHITYKEMVSLREQAEEVAWLLHISFVDLWRTYIKKEYD